MTAEEIESLACAAAFDAGRLESERDAWREHVAAIVRADSLEIGIDRRIATVNAIAAAFADLSDASALP